MVFPRPISALARFGLHERVTRLARPTPPRQSFYPTRKRRRSPAPASKANQQRRRPLPFRRCRRSPRHPRGRSSPPEPPHSSARRWAGGSEEWECSRGAGGSKRTLTSGWVRGARLFSSPPPRPRGPCPAAPLLQGRASSGRSREGTRRPSRRGLPDPDRKPHTPPLSHTFSPPPSSGGAPQGESPPRRRRGGAARAPCSRGPERRSIRGRAAAAPPRTRGVGGRAQASLGL